MPMRSMPGIDEIAVANADDNSVDTITASTGTWTGRIAFDLGLGSAPNHGGGIVAASEPAREWSELQWKSRGFIGA